jgi:hypothetical protein
MKQPHQLTKLSHVMQFDWPVTVDFFDPVKRSVIYTYHLLYIH